MKRIRFFAAIAALTLFMLTLTSCGQSVFEPTEHTSKLVVITAENAPKGNDYSVKTLEVDDGEQIVITSNLTKGSMQVEVFGMSAEQSEPTITLNASGTEEESFAVSAGEYWMKSTCLKKATGSIRVEVTPTADADRITDVS